MFSGMGEDGPLGTKRTKEETWHNMELPCCPAALAQEKNCSILGGHRIPLKKGASSERLLPLSS